MELRILDTCTTKGTQKRVRNIQGKPAIGVRVIKILLYNH